MSVVWYDNGLLANLLEDFPQDIKFDYWGIAGSSLYYSTMFASSSGLVQDIVNHPDFPWLQRTTATISRQEAGLGKVKIDFAGIPPNTNDKKYRVSGATSTEPIEAHQLFVSDIGGIVNLADGVPNSMGIYPNPQNVVLMPNQTALLIGTAVNGEKNGALFNLDGSFKGFQTVIQYPSTTQPVNLNTSNLGSVYSGALPTTLNQFAGIKSYLLGGITYEEVWTRGSTIGSPDDLAALGYIDTPPDPLGILPVVDGCNWLLGSGELDTQNTGYGSKLTRKWRLSGRRGWNAIIYTSP
jgi:hypothetical protein